MKMIFTSKNSRDYYEVLKIIRRLQQKKSTLSQRSGFAPERPTLPKKKEEALIERWAGISWECFSRINSKGYFENILKKEEAQKKFGGAHKIKLETSPPQASLRIIYDIVPSPFGECLIALSEGKICKLSFPENENNSYNSQKTSKSKAAILKELSRFWPKGKIEAAPRQLKGLATEIFYSTNKAFSLLVHASGLRLRVWQALLGLQKGAVIAYSQLAQYIGKPRAVRPVAGAVANNPISYLVPCHRVISKNAEIHAYRWGKERKLAMLLWEAACMQKGIKARF